MQIRNRQGSVEMLRFVAMFFVALNHTAGYGALGWDNQLYALYIPTTWAVPVFVSISGWFGIRFSWRKIVNFAIFILFYSVLFWSLRHFVSIPGAENPVPFEILTHSEDQMGASVRAVAPVGYPATSMRIMFDSHKIFVHKAITVGNDYDDRACRTKIVAEVPGDYEKLYTQWDVTGWHRVTVYGDVTKEVEALAAKIGYEVVYEA